MNPLRIFATIALLTASCFFPIALRADCIPNASNGFDCSPDFSVALSGDELETGRSLQQFQPPALLEYDTVAFIALTDPGEFLYEGFFWDKATATLLPVFERGTMNEGDFHSIALSTLDAYPSMAVSDSKIIAGPANFYNEFGSVDLSIASAGNDKIKIYAAPSDLGSDRILSIGGDTLTLVNAQGQIATRATIFEADRITRVGESILLLGESGGKIALAGEDSPPPLTGANWSGFYEPVTNRNLALNDLGRVAFSAALKNEDGFDVVTTDTDEVLVRQNTTELSILLREGVLAAVETPNVDVGSNGVGPTFNFISLNDNGDVGSMVRLRQGAAPDPFLTGGTQGGDDYDAIARVSGETDAIEFIAVRGEPPESIGFDTERLDGNVEVQISRLGPPQMNNSGDLAFFANLGTSPNDTNDGLGLFLYEAESQSYKRIFQTSGATFAEIVEKSDSVAGQSFFFTDGFSNDLAMNDSGDLAFTATTIADEFSPTRKGLFLYKDGELNLIAQVGSTVEIKTGDVRTVTRIEFLSGSSTSGRPSGLNDAGSLAYGLFFDDRSSGVFLDSFVPLPIPESPREILDFTLEMGPNGMMYPIVRFVREAGGSNDLFEQSGDLKSWEPVPTSKVSELQIEPSSDGETETVQARLEVDVADSEVYFARLLLRSDVDMVGLSQTVLNNGDDLQQSQVSLQSFSNDRSTNQTTANVVVNYEGQTTVEEPVLLVVESIDGSGVTVANADGTTGTGEPFFDLTGQVRGPSLDPGESTDFRPIVFNNSAQTDFDFVVRLERGDPRQSEPVAALEMETDEFGRALLALSDQGFPLTVRGSGTNAQSFDLEILTNPGSPGSLSFSSSSLLTSLSVTTSGGSENVATVDLRPITLSSFPGDVKIAIRNSGSDQVIAELPITILQVDILTGAENNLTAQNDRPATAEVRVTPAMPGVQIAFEGERLHRENALLPPGIEEPGCRNTFLGPQARPINGEALVTDATGRLLVNLTAGGGQGTVLGTVTAPLSRAHDDFLFSITESCNTCCGEGESAAILDYSGETKLSTTDLAIPGRGMNFALTRTYRSQASHLRNPNGDVGVDWCFSYIDDRIMMDGKNVQLIRSSFRMDTFTPTAVHGVYVSPMESYEQLTENDSGGYNLRKPNGTVYTYNGFGSQTGNIDTSGRLLRIEDRNGNLMSFLYGQPEGLSKTVLTHVVDSMGRTIEYRYYNEAETNEGRRGRLWQIEDFRRDNSETGRIVTYDYDTEGNLTSVTRPAIRGTPNGNDFPNGKTFRYDYITSDELPLDLTSQERDRLQHNLTHVWHPNQVGDEPAVNPQPPLAREVFTYGTDPSDEINFDRVQSHRLGGFDGNGNEAGGTSTYSYEQVSTRSPTPNDPFLRVTETDRRGNVEVNTYSAWDTQLERRELTRELRNNEPDAYVTSYFYDEDKNLISTIAPEGDSSHFSFDRSNSDRAAQGNIIATERLPGPRGGDQTRIRQSSTHEPIYQRTAQSIDPRGLDTAYIAPIEDASGRSQRDRYTTRYLFDYQEGDVETVLNQLAENRNTTVANIQSQLDQAGIALGLGDLNGDGRTDQLAGNVVRVEYPSVSLLPGSNQAAIDGPLQEIVELRAYNDKGQLISSTDPEGNETTYTYYPESDPDGDALATATPTPDSRTLDTETGGYLRQQSRDVAHLEGANSGNGVAPTNIRTQYFYDDVGSRIRETDARGVRHDYFVNEHNEVVQITKATAISSLPDQSPLESEELTAYAYVQRVYYDANGNVVREEIEDRGDTSNTDGFIETTREYDSLDNLLSETREVDIEKSLTTLYRYDANENRTLVAQPENTAQTYTYDERDLLFEETRGALSETSDTINPTFGFFNPRGGQESKVTYNYDLNGNLLERVDADDTDLSAANGSSIAGFGDATTYAYDGFNRRTRVIDAVGNESLTRYDPIGNTVEQRYRGPIGGPSPIDNLGANNVDLKFTRYHHDELNRVFQEDQELFVAEGVETKRVPDIDDSILTPEDGNVTNRYEYDRSSRQTFVRQDDGDTMQYVYDGAGRRIRQIDPEGNTVEYAYDDMGNLIETRETDVSQIAGIPNETFLTTYHYDALGRRTTKVENTVDSIGQTTRYRYDSRSNLVAVSDSNGQLSGQESQRRAFSTETVDINDPGNVTLFAYDGLNRKTSEVVVLTEITQGFGAQGSGNPGADEFGVKADIAVHSPDSNQGGGDGLITTTYRWDGNSLQTSITDDNGNQTIYAYDNLNRRISETKGKVVDPALADRGDPDTAITYTYDLDHNIVQTTDENGNIIDCTFDAINRRKTCNTSLATGVIGTTLQTFEFDGLNRLTRATDNNVFADPEDDSTVTYSYDSLNRVVEEIQKLGSLPARVISSGWRAENLKTSQVYPNGRIVDSTFDQLDRLNTRRDRGADQDLVDYDYIGRTRVLERSYPGNGARMTYLNDAGNQVSGYDSLRRPVELRHLRSDNSLVVGMGHSYDLMNNKLREEKLHDPGNSEVYQYDSAYRLTNFDRGTLDGAKTTVETPTPDSLQQQTWALDGLGNWNQTETTLGGVATNEERQHSSFNELVARDTTPLTHDNNGNQLTDGTTTYEWDYANRLRRITRNSDSAVIATYTYDALGRRIRKVVSNGGLPNDSNLDGTTHFFYDGWQVCEERDGADKVVKQYVYGNYIDEALVMDSNLDSDDSATGEADSRAFYHQNTLFSVYALTDVSGAIIESYQYDAYGRPDFFDDSGNLRSGASSSLSDNPYLFTGRRHDQESGTYYYRTRHLNSDTGRFTTRDNIGIWGDHGNFGNGYAYAGNNPSNHLDPNGEAWWPCFVACMLDIDQDEVQAIMDGNIDKLPREKRRKFERDFLKKNKHARGNMSRKAWQKFKRDQMKRMARDAGLRVLKQKAKKKGYKMLGTKIAGWIGGPIIGGAIAVGSTVYDVGEGCWCAIKCAGK